MQLKPRLLSIALLIISGCESPPTLADASWADAATDAGEIANSDLLPQMDAAGPVTDLPLVDQFAPADLPGPQPCAPAVMVEDHSQLVAQLSSQPWAFVGAYSNVVLSVSDDLQISGTITVGAKAVTIPAACLGRSDCRTQATFIIKRSIPGVVCNAPETVAYLNGCSDVSFTNATVRLRTTFVDQHVSQWNFVPVVEIEPACATPCASGEFRCLPNNTCWSIYDSYCRLCLGKDTRDCACLTEQGPKPDEDPCGFPVSGDVVCAGVCQAGYCNYTGKPGWAGCPLGP